MGGATAIAAGSILVGCVVLAMKGAAWWLTGSAAFYSDALESVVNVVSALLAFLALRLAAKPADANHPYGHEKAEVFAAVVEGGLIVAAALSILEQAWQSARDLHRSRFRPRAWRSTPSRASSTGCGRRCCCAPAAASARRRCSPMHATSLPTW